MSWTSFIKKGKRNSKRSLLLEESKMYFCFGCSVVADIIFLFDD